MLTKAEQLNIDVRAATLMVSGENIEDVTRMLCDEFSINLSAATFAAFHVLAQRKKGYIYICPVTTNVTLETLGAIRLIAPGHGDMAQFLRTAIKEKLERDSQPAARRGRKDARGRPGRE